MQPSTPTIEFTEAERKALAERQRRDEEFLLHVANLPAKECERRCRQRLQTRLARGRGMIRITRSRTVGPRPAARPTRPARASRIGRNRAAVRTSTPSRGDPDDDPDQEPGDLTGRAAELAEELQAAHDATIAKWQAQKAARGEYEQLKLRMDR